MNMKETFRPDETDIKILALLQADARLSHKELGSRVNKSITSIHNRVRRLEEQGFIQRYATILNPVKLGRGLIGYIEVVLEKHTEESLTAFMEAVSTLKEVMECYHLSGRYDFLLRVTIADMNEYSEVLMKKLSNLPGIQNFTSLFVLSEVKQETAFEIGKLK